jgi:hypothetical protein
MFSLASGKCTESLTEGNHIRSVTPGSSRHSVSDGSCRPICGSWNWMQRSLSAYVSGHVTYLLAQQCSVHTGIGIAWIHYVGTFTVRRTSFCPVSWSGVRLSPLLTPATIWPIVPAVDGWWWWWWVCSGQWNDWQEKPKYSGKTCLNATLSTTNPKWPYPGYNLATAVGSRRLTSWAVQSSYARRDRVSLEPDVREGSSKCLRKCSYHVRKT